jgi:hypothetical protein
MRIPFEQGKSAGCWRISVRKRQPIGGRISGAVTRTTQSRVNLGQVTRRSLSAPTGGPSESSLRNLMSPAFFDETKPAPASSSLHLPSAIAEHNAQGCCPSKVDERASDTEVEIARDTSIPVHAVHCSAIQCAPLRYRAQLKMITLCSRDFILTRCFRLLHELTV